MSHSMSRKNFSVAQRLGFGFSAIVALSLLGSAVSAWQAQVIGAKVERVVQVNNAMTDVVSHLRNSMDEMAIQARSIALMTEMKSITAEVDKLKAAKGRYLADEKYTLVVWVGGEALIRKSIRELLDGLEPETFIQIHRSTIVNLRFVAQVIKGPNETAEVHLKGRNETLSVSRNHVHWFRQY